MTITPGYKELAAMAVATSERPRWLRFAPLAIFAAALGTILINGWHTALTLENVFAFRDRFQAVISSHFVLAALAYVAAYAGVVALSVPGGAIFTLSGGLMFGWLLGGAAAVTGATLGALLLFVIAKTAFGESLRAKAGPAINGLVEGFQKDAFNYLLFLRLVPAFPFFVVNIAAALLGVPFRTYAIATFFGIMPATFAFASIGAGLDSVFAKAKADQAVCLANKAIALCPLELSPKSLVTKEFFIALTLLSLVALLPIAYKKWSQRRG
jgi:uncharacterized membrane protein YdjX (TVP38/TMEM64 family)